MKYFVDFMEHFGARQTVSYFLSSKYLIKTQMITQFLNKNVKKYLLCRKKIILLHFETIKSKYGHRVLPHGD